MNRLLMCALAILAVACSPTANSIDSANNLPPADTSTGLNEQGPLSTTASTPPPAPAAETSTARSGEPATYGQTAVLTPDESISGDEAVIMGLQGSWQNQSDEDETLQFNPDTYVVYYEGQVVVEEAISYHPNCPADCTGGVSADYPCFVVSSPYSTDCFGIVRMTTNELELTLLGQSTVTVLYNRITNP